MNLRGTLGQGHLAFHPAGYTRRRALGNMGCDLQSRCQREGQRGRDGRPERAMWGPEGSLCSGTTLRFMFQKGHCRCPVAESRASSRGEERCGSLSL